MLDYVPNPRPGALYLVRFTAPEFTSLCPVTGQPDFAHLVIDYAPGETIVESKSLKLFLAAFRNHAGFHEAVTVGIGERLAAEMKPRLAAHRRLLVSARRNADRRLLAIRARRRRLVGSGPGRRPLSRPGLRLGRSGGQSADRRPWRRLDRLLDRRGLAGVGLPTSPSSAARAIRQRDRRERPHPDRQRKGADRAPARRGRFLEPTRRLLEHADIIALVRQEHRHRRRGEGDRQARPQGRDGDQLPERGQQCRAR